MRLIKTLWAMFAALWMPKHYAAVQEKVHQILAALERDGYWVDETK